jgi:hypothetical protein
LVECLDDHIGGGLIFWIRPFASRNFGVASSSTITEGLDMTWRIEEYLHSCNDNFGVDVRSFAAIFINKEAINYSVAPVRGVIGGGAEILDTFYKIVVELLMLVVMWQLALFVPLPTREGGSLDHIFRELGKENCIGVGYCFTVGCLISFHLC